MAKFNPVPGGPDDENLEGTAGKDLITGEGGSDVLYGFGKRDILDGGLDTGEFDFDSLYGGTGKDLFVFATGYGEDRIEDYELKKDGLDLSGTSFARKDLKDVDKTGTINDSDGDGNYVRVTSSNGEPELQLNFGNGDRLTIIGVTLKQFKQDVKHYLDHYDFG
jgi:Ca2+-binding RTX toxin-like protein